MNPTKELSVLIRDIFEQCRTIAVYGMSSDPAKPSHSVPSFLSSKGYTIIPINPTVETILGRKSHPNLNEIEEEIEILEVFRPSEKTPEVVKEAVSRKKDRGDIRVIWLQQGIHSEEARRLAEEAGILFIQDRCMRSEFKRAFPER